MKVFFFCLAFLFLLINTAGDKHAIINCPFSRDEEIKIGTSEKNESYLTITKSNSIKLKINSQKIYFSKGFMIFKNFDTNQLSEISNTLNETFNKIKRRIGSNEIYLSPILIKNCSVEQRAIFKFKYIEFEIEGIIFQFNSPYADLEKLSTYLINGCQDFNIMVKYVGRYTQRKEFLETNIQSIISMTSDVKELVQFKIFEYHEKKIDDFELINYISDYLKSWKKSLETYKFYISRVNSIYFKYMHILNSESKKVFDFEKLKKDVKKLFKICDIFFDDIDLYLVNYYGSNYSKLVKECPKLYTTEAFENNFKR